MTIETQLRDALRERAGDVPDASVARVTAYAYHPRTRHHLPRPRLAIGGGVATAAGAAAVIVALTGGATSAFAGWKATPTKAAPGQLGAAGRACTSQGPVGGLPLALSDVRGPFTLQVYANDTTSATCINGPGISAVRVGQSSRPENPSAGEIQISRGPPAAPGNQPYSFSEGRIGSGVQAVTLNLSDGATVDATVGHGWYLAWWPSDATLRSATVATAAGDHMQTPQAISGPGNGTPKKCPPGPPCISVSDAGGGNRIAGNGPAVRRLQKALQSQQTQHTQQSSR
jgi:hypothetical protein